MIGKTLAHYKIIALLGKGGMGEVYRARDLRLDRDVALKVLAKTEVSDVKSARRFDREAKVLASLEHVNIATIYGFHNDAGVQFMAMELISGDTLEAKIVKNGLALDDLLDVGIPLAEAIAFAHGRGVIHRDLKPANVMLDTSGRVQVLDFGLAAFQQAPTDIDPEVTLEDALTTAGTVMGTVSYMAPEQMEGRSVDERADVFSLGVVLYELATGKRPFGADSAVGVASAILRDTPVPVRESRPDLPADLGRVIRRCLEKKVDRRMQTARDVYNELEELRAGVRTAEQTGSQAPAKEPGSLAERRMKITTEHVRQLHERIPRMVGDSMTYLDNDRRSDVLVICLHGIGADQRDFVDVLRETQYRAVSLSLFGFGPMARMRTALSFADHNLLVGFLIQDICQQIAPQTLVIVGHSSGAEQCLQLVASPLGERLRPDGLVLLGPAVLPGEGRISGPYSRMTVDPADIFNTLHTLSGFAEDLTEWLILHDYLVRAFSKFKTDIAALQVFAKTYIETLEGETFFGLFRTATERTRHLRCVFATDDAADADRAVEQHITANALGDGYSEEMLVNVPTGHIDLRNASVVLPQIEEIVRRNS